MHREMNMPPAEFQEKLNLLGGFNRYDEPNFRIWWSQYAHGDGSYRAGGRWSVDEATFIGYRDLLRGDGSQCWCLGQWHDASEYSSPEAYYVTNLDEETNLSILGEYPYSGRVELLYNMRWFDRGEDGRMEFHSMPIADWVFDMIVPIIIAAKDVSIEKRKEAYLEAKRLAEDEKANDIERHLHDKSIPFTGNVSFTRQGIRSTVIDQKMLDLHRAWNDLQSAARKFRPGLQTR